MWQDPKDDPQDQGDDDSNNQGPSNNDLKDDLDVALSDEAGARDDTTIGGHDLEHEEVKSPAVAGEEDVASGDAPSGEPMDIDEERKKVGLDSDTEEAGEEFEEEAA